MRHPNWKWRARFVLARALGRRKDHHGWLISGDEMTGCESVLHRHTLQASFFQGLPILCGSHLLWVRLAPFLVPFLRLALSGSVFSRTMFLLQSSLSIPLLNANLHAILCPAEPVFQSNQSRKNDSFTSPRAEGSLYLARPTSASVRLSVHSARHPSLDERWRWWRNCLL